MPVRDLDAFALEARRVHVTASRGANGIDGTIATTAGLALGFEGPVVALLGDLAFLHDHGALLAARQLGASLTLVVVDNGGGGIFGSLPIAAHEGAFRDYFLTPQQADIGRLCEGAFARWCRVESAEALEGALDEAVGRPGVTVIQAAVDRVDSSRRRAAALA
jgi:2-succinyl-5-enolpyruvyl-6-hydroxy-3-cyclohexene-1-carboxylate synthase